MAEHVLRGQVNIVPGDDGARHVLVVEPSGDVYRIPMSPQGSKDLGQALCMSDEEIAAKKARAQAAERLVVPGNGAMPSMN